ncbi:MULTISPECIES: DUF881 domain-containing protein [Clostridium]|jgi:Uncharacterized protein conserved in bacteria|uniref:DUF881 domain-containing protein n=4 Tax=Clostridium TaxID=1485 RepID=A0A0B5QKF9_CLOBE|nr:MULTISPECIES: DUF881 domain-containing protein [Clostridium]ABR33759.1 protein of unknown function DUF881 [Clostridium beijerinckii NCIMB 8052]AIU03351.1 hypothetical protein Cbs_1585 [Clostridium beijerinckii ATCC 35702]AJG98402.1 division initiation protein [Clostridium beijerinckii]ALB47133.1 DUF881 domain-containing protein [Clostridium beijerinckii NRRL B-598]AQS04279.1 hypothetical protein CLBIJ_16980 [Clostridium beijerinckii]
MKISRSQLFIAIVCGLLGFLLAYQFKVLSNKNIESKISNYDKNDIISEVESLKKEKEELASTNSKLSDQLKQMEETAAKNGDMGQDIKNQLDEARMHLGIVDVKGQGIVLTITPKTSIFGSTTNDSSRDLGEDELVHIVNLLWYSGAEAISINDIRITPQTGIKTAGNGIAIGSTGKVYPRDKIIIKAIGDKGRLNVGISFPGSLEYLALPNYNNEVKSEDDIFIGKSKQSLKSDFIKSVKE